MIWYIIFVNCNWVATWWQQYSTHLHTHNTQNDPKQTIHRPRTTQKFWKSGGHAPSLGVYPGICLTTEEKACHYICTTRSIILPVFPFTFKYSPPGLMAEKVFVMAFKLQVSILVVQLAKPTTNALLLTVEITLCYGVRI